jgi:hypothetical protein
MLKKLDISEKLKKFSNEAEKRGSLLRPKRPSEVKPEIQVEPEEERPAPEGGEGPEGAQARDLGGSFHPMMEFILDENDIKKVKTKYQEVGEEKLEQVVTIEGRKPVDLKWSVTKDPFAEEFSMLTRELKLVKTSPPIYASEFQNARIVTSHVGLYTFTMGSFKMELERLVETFTGVLKSKGLI